MDDASAKAMMIRQARRELLKLLAIMYQIGPLSFEAICEGLDHLELPDDECVKRDLTYLCEKGYVIWSNARAQQPWKERMYKATARGTEIADQLDRDPVLEP